MASQAYEEMYQNYIDALAAFSGGTNTETFRNLVSGGLPAYKQEAILKQAGYTFIKNSDGTFAYIGKPTIDPPASDNALITNSNLQTGTSGTNGGAYYEEPFGTEGTGTASGNVKESATKVFRDGAAVAGTKILGVAGKTLSTVMAYQFGLNLGKLVDGALYDANPDFWDEKGMQSLDPDTWGQISSEIDNPAGRFAFNLMAGVRTDESTSKPTLTMYADEDAQAYFAKWLVEKGFFNSGGTSDVSNFKPTVSGYTIDSVLSPPFNGYPISNGEYPSYYNSLKIENGGEIYAYYYNYGHQGVFISNTPFTIYVKTFTTSDWEITDFVRVYHEPATEQHGEFYYADVSTIIYNNNILKDIVPFLSSYNETHSGNINSVRSAANIFFYNTTKPSGGNPPSGVHSQQGATIFDPSALTSDSTISDYRTVIRDQFPDLYNNRVEYSVAQPDGSTKTFTYIPIPIADAFNQNVNQPIGDVDTTYQGNYSYDGSNMSDTLISTILNWLTNEKASNLTDPKDYTGTKTPPNAPDTGSGNTPSFIPVTGKASSLYAIYNPTLAQVNSLGAWLWSSDFIDQILKLFSDPMQAIIGLHKVFVTPITGGEQNIKVGYLDSGVSSKVVTEQYVTIDCGTIDCAEYFGNVFDYSPYTNIQIYLPFIGIVDLSTSDVMRSKINVVYHVDVLSGACLAEIKVLRDSYGGTLYQYAGNASVTMPISSGSYIGVISNVVGVAARAVSGFAAGGAVGAVAGGVTGALSAHGGTSVQHSGGFSGNAGAMGIKKPYLIIERPQTEIAENTDTLLGYGSNKYVTLSECAGYTRVKAVHVDKISSATQEEKQEIENALMRGVIIR